MKINKALNTFVDDENGSAIVEFIMLAIPLFIPLAFYLTSISQISTLEYDARNYVRQVARVYVTSPSQEDVAARISELNQVFFENNFRRDNILANPELTIQCSDNPCLTPGGDVSVNAILHTVDGKYSASASVVQHVDKWRSS
ncbi:MAG: hypothetical protein NTZ31_03970 [Actinobacteria bacterium]|jgi:Flp pilus assembly protein TadG|nr:hypothetical protein [Actinomycetota bacterium]